MPRVKIESGSQREASCAASVLHPRFGASSGRLSSWTSSRSKRAFDIAAVFALSPLLLPLLGVIAALLFLTSNEPVLYRQLRVGSHGNLFTILKFRTMRSDPDAAEDEVAAKAAGRITRLGAFLRVWKLDELPQALNVLRGDMSLVGPRPKVPGHDSSPLDCRPGLTGAATLAFAREDEFLSCIPNESLAEFYQRIILPAKRRLDAEYAERASLFSDLQILAATALRIWRVRDMSAGEAKLVFEISTVIERGAEAGV